MQLLSAQVAKYKDKKFIKSLNDSSLKTSSNLFRKDGDTIPNVPNFKEFLKKYNFTNNQATLIKQSDKPQNLFKAVAKICREPINSFDIDILRFKLQNDPALAKKILNDPEVKRYLEVSPEDFNYYKTTQNGQTFFASSLATDPNNLDTNQQFMNALLNPRASGLTQIAEEIEQYCPWSDLQAYNNFDYRVIPSVTLKSKDQNHCFYQNSRMMIITHNDIFNKHFDKQIENASKKYLSYTFTLMISSDPNKSSHEIAVGVIFEKGRIKQLAVINPQSGSDKIMSLKEYYLPLLKQLANIPQKPPGTMAKIGNSLLKAFSILPFIDEPKPKNSKLSAEMQKMVKNLIGENGELKDPLDEKAFKEYERLVIDAPNDIPGHAFKIQGKQGSCARDATTSGLVLTSGFQSIGKNIAHKSLKDNTHSLELFANQILPYQDEYLYTQFISGCQNTNFYSNHLNNYYQNQNKSKNPNETKAYIKQAIASSVNIGVSEFDLIINTNTKGIDLKINTKKCSPEDAKRLNYAVEMLKSITNEELAKSNNENPAYKMILIEKAMTYFKPSMFKNINFELFDKNQVDPIAPKSDISNNLNSSRLSKEQFEVDKKVPHSTYNTTKNDENPESEQLSSSAGMPNQKSFERSGHVQSHQASIPGQL